MEINSETIVHDFLVFVSAFNLRPIEVPELNSRQNCFYKVKIYCVHFGHHYNSLYKLKYMCLLCYQSMLLLIYNKFINL